MTHLDLDGLSCSYWSSLINSLLFRQKLIHQTQRIGDLRSSLRHSTLFPIFTRLIQVSMFRLVLLHTFQSPKISTRMVWCVACTVIISRLLWIKSYNGLRTYITEAAGLPQQRCISKTITFKLPFKYYVQQ